ncbi:DDE-type integrase/transposase/recombinase [Notoacmeibacter ruber]|uniref:Integrase n=1 Tax=Notoacmeibacter ruber TaxID=2670375 RepID=A0A3L7JEY3_9HYPH|nr:DDE-type integrase/transposase/recombinase [Notoacmeibacter ruber]RLQ88885.1 integrase [Notoacmeibacter ruber]
MKEWLTARELAGENLSEIPSTERAVQLLADREGWNENPAYARRRSGRGGGMEYHYRILPTLARVAYEQRYRRVGAEPVQADNDEPAQEALSAAAAKEGAARLAITNAFENFKAGSTLRQTAALQIFCDKFNARSLHVEDWVVEIVPRLSKRSLARWLSKKKSGATLGVDRSAARKGSGTLDIAEDGRVRDFIIGLIAHQPHLSAHHVRTQIRAEFGDGLKVLRRGVETRVTVPPIRSIQRFIATLKEENAVVLTKLINPDAFRSHMKLRGTGTLRHIGQPNELWQIDASPVDALCTDGRHSIYACIDIATRRVIILMSRTPKASAVGLLIRKAILEWGVPTEIKIDNGSDFKARATQRLFASLGIDVAYSDAYSPEQKGHVERVIKTFQHDAVALVPGFVGHNVTDRKAIESRKSFAKRLGEDDAQTFAVQMDGAQMQAVFDEWARLHYQHKPHSGLKGRTPFEVAATSNHTIRSVDARALDMLLAPVPDGGYRTVTATGVRVANFHYLNGEILPGKRVFVRQDPNDMGRIFLFDNEEGEFLGEALNAELAGLPPEAFVAAEKAKQAELLKDMSAEIDRQRRAFRKGPALIERARDVWLRDQPNVTPLPRPSVEHRTAEIEAALEASEGPKAPQSKLSDQIKAMRETLAKEAAETPEPTAKVTTLNTRNTRFRRARDLEARMAAGETLSNEDALWLGGYREDPEYRAMADMKEVFGDRMKV